MKVNISKKWIVNIIAVLVIIILMCVTAHSCSRIKELKQQNTTNIEAFTDSLTCYKDANGQLVAEKKLLLCEYEDIKKAYSSLYKDLDGMKVENAELAAQVKSLISNPKVEIRWKTDTISKPYENIILPFSDKNDYRSLAGKLLLDNDDIILNIDEDKVYLKYTFAVKDNTVYINSDNPYVMFEDVTGYRLPEEKKQKHFGFGAYLGMGVQYGIITKSMDIGPQLGVGVVYRF